MSCNIEEVSTGEMKLPRDEVAPKYSNPKGTISNLSSDSEDDTAAPSSSKGTRLSLDSDSEDDTDDEVKLLLSRDELACIAKVAVYTNTTISPQRFVNTFGRPVPGQAWGEKFWPGFESLTNQFMREKQLSGMSWKACLFREPVPFGKAQARAGGAFSNKTYPAYAWPAGDGCWWIACFYIVWEKTKPWKVHSVYVVFHHA